MPQVQNPRRHKSLWLWGCFGVLTSTTYIIGVKWDGGGRTAFLNASSGIFIAALAPFLTKQKVPLIDYLGVVASLLGMFLLSRGNESAFSPGAFFSIASGLFAGLAYLMVARTHRSYSPLTVMLHWGLCNLAAYIAIFSFSHQPFPQELKTWLLVITGALAAASSQYFTVKAFQNTRASFIACLSFLGPTLNVILDMSLFKLQFEPQVFLGAAIVLIFGVLLPWRKNQVA